MKLIKCEGYLLYPWCFHGVPIFIHSSRNAILSCVVLRGGHVASGDYVRSGGGRYYKSPGTDGWDKGNESACAYI